MAVADRVLIRRVREGDETALQKLFSRYEDRLRARIEASLSPSLGRKVSADDILQETYLTAYRRLGGFEPGEDGAFGVWLMRIAAFKLKEEARRYRATAKRAAVKEITRGARPDTLWFAGKDPSPSEAAIGEELHRRAARAMEVLPPHYARVLRLVQVENMTLRDAAERMGCTRDAAKKLYGRALNKLSELLEEDGGDRPRG